MLINKSQRCATISVILLVCAFLAGCKKTGQSVSTENQIIKPEPIGTASEEFFKFYGSLPPLVSTIRNYVMTEDAMHHFSIGYLKRLGRPVWNKAMSFTGNSSLLSATEQIPADSSITYIPFAKDGRVTAALIVKISGIDTVSTVIFANRYADFGFNERADAKWNARTMFYLFARFENSVFGTTQFIIKDENLLNSEQKNFLRARNLSFDAVKLTYKLDTTARQSSFSRQQATMICNTFEWCIKFDVRPISKGDVITMVQGVNCLEWQYETECYTYWIEIWDNIGSGAASSGGGASGSGNSWPQPNPCAGRSGRSTGKFNRSSDANADCNPTVPGWEPVVMSQLDAFRQMLQPGDEFELNVPATGTSFPSTQSFESYKNEIGDISKTSYDISKPTVILSQNEKVKTASFNLNFVGGVDVDVKLQQTNGLWSVKDVTSDTWGFTPMVKWDQSAYSSALTGNELTVDVKGKMSYNIIIQGIGTIYKQEFRFRMKINNITGEFISISRF